MRKFILIGIMISFFNSNFSKSIDKDKFTKYLWKGFKVTRAISLNIVNEIQKELKEGE